MYVHCNRFTTTIKELSTDLSSFLYFSITDPLAQQHLYILSCYSQSLRQFHGALPLLPASNDSQCSFLTMKGLTASRMYNAHWKPGKYSITLSLCPIVRDSILEISLIWQPISIVHATIQFPSNLAQNIIDSIDANFLQFRIFCSLFLSSFFIGVSCLIRFTESKIKFEGNFN